MHTYRGEGGERERECAHEASSCRSLTQDPRLTVRARVRGVAPAAPLAALKKRVRMRAGVQGLPPGLKHPASKQARESERDT